MNAKAHPTPSIDRVVRAWKKACDASLLRQTQQRNPLAWQSFYSSVAKSWDRMTGASLSGRDMVSMMKDQGMVFDDDRVLDLGCGSGRLALALARQGIRVTALDSNPAMIGRIHQTVENERLKGISALVHDWLDFIPYEAHTLTAACFFPEALSPQGLERMEALSTDRCMLVLGDGSEAFPLRQTLWEKIMDTPLPLGGFHIPHALDFLDLCGRSPALLRLSRPVVLDVTADCALSYYSAYFAIFGKTGTREKRILSDVIASFTHGERIRINGVSHTVLLCWRRVPGRPLGRCGRP